MRTKTIALPRLDNLRPTLESTALKLMEEAGELGAAIGKYRALSGEPASLDGRAVAEAITRELLDVAQTAVTMMFVLEEQYGVDVQAALRAHVEKLMRKGYLSGSPA
jgi:NTP pyrophosphatase (non-canonical NTP hydrolase)